MTTEEMMRALSEIKNLYELMQVEYNVDLSRQIKNVEQVKHDLPKTIIYVERS